LTHILKGKKNISQGTIVKIANGLKLKGRELDFFECLVKFNQSNKKEEQEFFLSQLITIRPKKLSENLLLEQYSILENWHCTVIREMVGLPDFREDPVFISNRLNGRIRPSQVKKALQILKSTKLLVKDENGKLVHSDRVLRTTDEIQSLAIQKYHKSCMELGSEVIVNTPLKKREFSSVTMTLSPEQFEKLKDKIKIFRDEIIRMELAKPSKENQVCQFNMQFFSMT
jgi:uncharacterized protein (TIGR02147 family)